MNSHAVQDQYVSGMSHVEVLSGGCSRYVFYTDERGEDGNLHRTVSLRLVMPVEALPDAVMKSCSAASFALLGVTLRRYN